MSNTRGTSPDGYSECGYTKAPSDTCYTVFSGDTLLLNCKIMSNARTTSPGGYSECGYTKAPSDMHLLYCIQWRHSAVKL